MGAAFVAGLGAALAAGLVSGDPSAVGLAGTSVDSTGAGAIVVGACVVGVRLVVGFFVVRFAVVFFLVAALATSGLVTPKPATATAMAKMTRRDLTLSRLCFAM